MMKSAFVTAPDGIRLAYDVSGSGPSLLLLHGGGDRYSRRSWHDTGYVKQLASDFRVITMDIRGHGDSGRPTNSASYTIETMCQDVLTVADACSVAKFIVWGFSYGGNIGRFLAVRSDRVAGLIIMGIPFGPAAGGEFRQFIHGFQAHWAPIVQAKRDGRLDAIALTEEDRKRMQQANIPVLLAWLTAMLDWGGVEPAELPCRTLWLVGSENEVTIASVGEYEANLAGTNVHVEIIPGLNHVQEFDEINRVLPIMLGFTKGV